MTCKSVETVRSWFNNEVVGQLRIAQFEDNSVLEAVGEYTFSAGEAQPELAEVNVHQGQRERSNVNATQELVQMIVGRRQHEAASNALRSLAEALEMHTSPQGA